MVRKLSKVVFSFPETFESGIPKTQYY